MREVSSVHRECPICGSVDSDKDVVVLGPYKVRSCNQCGGQSVWPPPSSESLSAAYTNFDAGLLARSNMHKYVPQAEHILASTIPCHQEPIQRTFLDYGCGGGHFVQAATNLGFQAVGLEFDSVSVSEARTRGLDVRQGSLPENGDVVAGQLFDIVLSHHVLEHVPNPHRTLSALIDRTRCGGLILVGVPDQDSLPSAIKKFLRRFGIKKGEWGYVQPPIHLHGFTTATFAFLARKHGLQLTNILRISPLDPQGFPSTSSYWRKLPLQWVIYQIARLARSPGYLLVVLQKPGQASATVPPNSFRHPGEAIQ